MVDLDVILVGSYRAALCTADGTDSMGMQIVFFNHTLLCYYLQDG